ncbi:Uu.00g115440.m01.CDS01 [Anthostomella pinea]|uniref:Uu.00g115440.m01.CDS01 n=1 Tax=Anthostomella pinea TaxID=933095 RepID=A0AAI8VGS7_9PEZI|nr:Uu.00g115440.m01.CDS01 [Anthostomella pinea]
MTFRVFDDRVLGSIFVVALICTPIAILVTVLRFVATRKSQRKIGWEDYLALLALLFNLGFNIMELWSESNLGQATWPPASISIVSHSTLTDLRLKRVKPSAICPSSLRHNPAHSESGIFDKLHVPFEPDLCEAQPVDPLLSHILLEQGLHALSLGRGSINSAVDFVMVGMAIYMVRKLQVSTRNKWRLSVVFALGDLTGLIGFVKIGDSYSSVGFSGLDAVWDILQMCASIICCCTPIYRVLLSNVNLFGSVKSMFRSLVRSTDWRLLSGKESAKSTGTGQSMDTERLPPPRHLGLYNGSSTAELAWTEVEAGNHGNWSSGAKEGQASYPMQAVQVQRTFEVV